MGRSAHQSGKHSDLEVLRAIPSELKVPYQ